jgi:membrane protein
MVDQPKPAALFHLVDRIKKEVWNTDLRDVPRSRRLLVESVRLVWQVGSDIWEGQLTLRAMSLVYTTLLSLIPLFAISFSVLKGFGVHREIEPFLISFLAPLGERAEEIVARIIEFIDNTNVSVLGYVGFALLFYAVVSLMQKIEGAFNYVWRVTRNRTLPERLRDYLTLIMVGPTLMIAAGGIWASLLSTDLLERMADVAVFGWLVNILTRALPVLIIVIAFTFIYTLVPNTKVRWRPALTGGILAGLMWNLGGVGFALFVANSANYPAIYSSFATAIFFMIWLYLAWMILLIGASISFHAQNPTMALRFQTPLMLSIRLKEKLALAIAVAVAKRFYRGLPPHTAASLTDLFGIPAAAIDDTIAALETAGLLLHAGENDDALVLARSWDTVSVREVIGHIRAYGEVSGITADEVSDTAIADVWHRFESTLGMSVDDVSLKELALPQDSPSAAHDA